MATTPLPSAFKCMALYSSKEDSNNNVEAAATITSAPTTTTTATINQSTLTLLEHINLNVPSHEYILDFYYQVLGCGMDPRKAQNLKPNAPKKTLWANCGASQFHLPYGDVGQAVRGHIGLRVDDLNQVRQQLETFKDCYQSYKIVDVDGGGKPACIQIVDMYGNQFHCRPSTTSTNNPRLTETWKQPIIAASETIEWGDIATTFGIKEKKDEEKSIIRTNCQGIDYVEFLVPAGTAETIALFYEKVFDATTTVLTIDAAAAASSPSPKIAIVAFGNISPQGRADQSLIFRETTDSRSIPDYDGHHIALYAGQDAKDFDYAFQNCLTADVVWVNPRFSDKVTSLPQARIEKQFRFKDIIDLNTGEVVYELEHEVRSVEHEAFPAPPKKPNDDGCDNV
eukprot:CAMPEP_0198152100 /NCGR_PEP_ID=MMETSP1443-20131203/58486_1 /TAXON_ID=186043 /ORGANISM="Entomoneis sp., Strain CCMP2396" /LENGTH=396 /DNA_ID=CAMNT_0043818007 /DNA_START=121 /DNA_END=1311 /DNA_ORIENTATION=+